MKLAEKSGFTVNTGTNPTRMGSWKLKTLGLRVIVVCAGFVLGGDVRASFPLCSHRGHREK